ncbi:nucleotide-diphosphate-sugar epimerase [Lentzea sp. NBRC 105346]|uniref:SDR family oxidoreductase n=1 Tax=Lentzea sp. NBRC 105346 TaxID=3032205 RepID=UPI0024A3BAC1|nr:NAD(P)H-binding protein [Lentzea sp. NBRC 105346]GLZ34997.1 nucleotide-diphosphate-sugar epimerase [Lentzea sp. NBRC 105346]
MKILVTGATGNVGRFIVDELLAGGHEVRAFTRKPETANLPEGAEVFGGDLGNEADVKAALEGVDKVHLFLNNSAAPGQHQMVAKTIAEAGIPHIVALSSASAGGDPNNLIAQVHLSAEAAVRDSGVAYTFLRPGGYHSNAFEWIESIKNEGVVRAPFGFVKRPDVDPRDIASVAVASLTGEGHENKIYPLSGPIEESTAERVAILAKVLGREIRFEDIPEEVYAQMMAQWMPAEAVAALVDLTKQAGQKKPGELLWSTVQDVTARAPISFEQWAIDNKDAFA